MPLRMPNTDSKLKKYKPAVMSKCHSVVCPTVWPASLTHKVGSNNIWKNTDCFLTHWLHRSNSLEIVTFREMNKTLAFYFYDCCWASAKTHFFDTSVSYENSWSVKYMANRIYFFLVQCFLCRQMQFLPKYGFHSHGQLQNMERVMLTMVMNPPIQNNFNCYKGHVKKLAYSHLKHWLLCYISSHHTSLAHFLGETTFHQLGPTGPSWS